MQSNNNLRQLAIAMHNYHDANRGFPRPAILDAAGKPLLSWRVELLPYLDEHTLYNHFQLDEPWDSPHNLDLLRYMPDTFAPPGLELEDPNGTFYQVFVGPGAVFDPGRKKAVSLASVTDGSAHTLLIVEAAEPVPWTKPVDLPFAADQSLPKLGGIFFGGFNAAFCDSRVRFLPGTLQDDEPTLRALIGMNDGVRVDISNYGR
jgi:hypothetical protein